MALLSEDFSLEELRTHIKKKLGGSVWRLEGMSDAENDLVDQGISDAMLAYSRRCPRERWEVISTISTKSAYTLQEPGYGPWRVDYIEPVPLVAPITFNLLGVTPISNFAGNDIAGFINWRKSFRRVISSDPLWKWDADEKVLYLYNIANITKACVWIYLPTPFDRVPLIHKDYIRRASIAHVKHELGLIRRKYGDIPGPGGNSIKMDGDSLVKEAEAELEKLNEELMSFQPRAIPFYD